MAYKILKSMNPDALELEVEAFESNGWFRSGGVSGVARRARELIVLVNVVEVEYEIMYLQAMSKEPLK